MKNKLLTKRNILFIKRNLPNFVSVRDYISDLCTVYGIKDYNFIPYSDDELALFLSIGNKKFIVYLDINSLKIKVVFSNEIISSFSGDAGWSSALRFIDKHNKSIQVA